MKSHTSSSPLLSRRRYLAGALKAVSCASYLFIATIPNANAAPGNISQDALGVSLQTTGTGLTRVEVWGQGIAHVIHSPTVTLPPNPSVAVTGSAAAVAWQYQNYGAYFLITTGSLTVKVATPSGRVTFLNVAGTTLLAESATGTSLQPTTVGSPAVASYAVTQKFNLSTGEAIYGLGQHQAGVMNYVGTSVTLQQENTEVALPVWLSSNGYAVLWDDPAVTVVDVGLTVRGVMSVASEAGNEASYYFCYGPSSDQAISEYRLLTGAAPMLGKWFWGFWQSKEHYATQQQLLDVANEYRALGIPIDGIVQDWLYWPTLNQTTAAGGWGSDLFDPTNYPDPFDTFNTLHSQNLHILISKWAKFDVTNSGLSIANLQEFENATPTAACYPQVIPYVDPAGQGQWFDPFNPVGRQIFWSEISQNLFSMGIDAWWLDASEPELSGNWGEFRDYNTALGSGAQVYNAYPLEETTAVYQGQRAQTSAKRVFILTRSAYSGQQRNAAVTWSGDLQSTWPVFAAQIPAGLNFSASGIPYWNTDIGGFFSGNPATTTYAELFTRWFQFGTFCPMMRVHGTNYPKEVWRFPTATQPILVNYINLRYRLLPYNYSVSWMVTNSGYTMMRPLVMDFPSDTNIANIGNEYMFGPAMLVTPVTVSGATTQSVYLPAGTKWYDFWTGITYSGSQTITAAAPIQTMPLFVKAGSILPFGTDIQYAAQSSDPIELRVYRGANGAFTLYEDEGDNYDYESSAYSTIPFTWNDSTSVLTIGASQGTFPGMPSGHTFRVVFVTPQHGVGTTAVTPADVVVNYTGSAVSVPVPATPAAPAAPTGLTAVSGSGQISLSWNAVSGDAVYTIARATSSGGTYTTIVSDVGGTSYVDTGATGGTTYYYEVAATNVGGGGPFSTPVSASSGGSAFSTLLMFHERSGTTPADASGNAWGGTLHGGSSLATGTGGNAVTLDGASGYASLPTGVVASLNNFTVAAWVKLSTIAAWARIFDFGSGTNSYMFLTPKNGSTNTIRFAITTSGNTGEQQINGTAPLTTGSWTHVAVTVSGSVGTLYVNGVQVGQNSALTLNPTSLGNSTQNWIGRSQYSGDPYLSGQIDDFRIYSGALSASAILALANGTASALLSPWSDQDIGSVGFAGSAGSPGNNYYVTASGADIQGSSDAMHYVWQSWTGDGTLIARVRGVQALDPWTKAGIMFRNSLSASDVNAYLADTPGNGTTFQYRSTSGGGTSYSNLAGFSAPYWLKLVRSGTTNFTPYQSPDGINWSPAGVAVSLPMPTTCYLGLAVTAHNNTYIAAAQYDNVTIVDPTLAVPAALIVTATNGQVALSWQAAPGATSYNVLRSLTAGGPYAPIATGLTGLTFTDSSVTNGTTYYYEVVSVNGDRESVSSTSVSATPLSDFQLWKQTYGLPIGIANNATPDQDGISVLMKFATGLIPGFPATNPATLNTAGNALQLQFNRISPAPVNYVVQASSDLSNWATVSSLQMGSNTWTGNGTVSETGTGSIRATTITDSQAIGATPTRFLRLSVYRPTP